MNWSGLAKRRQVSTAHQMQMQGDATKGVLHHMVAISKGDNMMECVFSHHIFPVTYLNNCDLLPQNGCKVSLTGFSGPDGTLVVGSWNECSQAEHDARILERVVFEIRKRKLQQAEENSLWTGDDDDFLKDYNEDNWQEVKSGIIVKNEVVGDDTYNMVNDEDDPPPPPPAKQEVYDEESLCDMLHAAESNGGAMEEQAPSPCKEDTQVEQQMEPDNTKVNQLLQSNDDDTDAKTKTNTEATKK